MVVVLFTSWSNPRLTGLLGAIMDEQVNVNVNVKPSNEQRINYYQKILAKRTIGKRGTVDGEFENPLRMHVTRAGLAYDEALSQIYYGALFIIHA